MALERTAPVLVLVRSPACCGLRGGTSAPKRGKPCGVRQNPLSCGGGMMRLSDCSDCAKPAGPVPNKATQQAVAIKARIVPSPRNYQIGEAWCCSDERRLSWAFR